MNLSVPPIVRKTVDALLGRNPDLHELRRCVDEVKSSRAELRESVSQLGQDVWGMVETGDPLRALVHGARQAKFHGEDGKADE
jgi:hypothetical protein